MIHLNDIGFFNNPAEVIHELVCERPSDRAFRKTRLNVPLDLRPLLTEHARSPVESEGPKNGLGIVRTAHLYQ